MKFSLLRVRLNQGGYTDHGQYFGIGMPLYWYQDIETGDESDYIRAYDRTDAKLLVQAKYPDATSYR